MGAISNSLKICNPNSAADTILCWPLIFLVLKEIISNTTSIDAYNSMHQWFDIMCFQCQPKTTEYVLHKYLIPFMCKILGEIKDTLYYMWEFSLTNTRIIIMIENEQLGVSIITNYIVLKFIGNFLVCDAYVLGMITPKDISFITNDLLQSILSIPLKVPEKTI